MDASLDASDRDRPETAAKRETRRLLTAELVMTQAGEYDLYSMKELILREEELEGLDEGCAPSLASLEILSLSHNRLPSLEHFEHLVNLIELNLNFNRISSLEHLQCPGLEKLFVAGNNIADISPLRRLPKLNTVSLYGNQLSDLDAALHTCRALPQLRALDLGGNPCSRELEGYKFRVVRVLPRLKTLDGDHVTPLDKELAEEFVVRGASAIDDGAARKRGANRGSTSDVARPMTAPVGGLGGRGYPYEASNARVTNPFRSADMPRGNVRLFRDDFLNSNPILLEYLAEGVRDESALEADGAVQATRSKFQDDSDGYSSDEDHEEGEGERRRVRGGVGGGFVGRMRTANPIADASGAEENDADVMRLGSTGEMAMARPTTASALGATPTSSLGVDPSDPKATVRKLLKHIEVLMETIASYKNRELDSCRQALLDENTQLRIENNNIPVLRSEVEDLKKRLTASQAGGGASGAAGANAQRVQALEKENASFKREIARLEQSLRQQQARDQQAAGGKAKRLTGASTSCDNSTGASAQAVDEAADATTRLSNSTLLDESAEVDVELTELILQNEVALELIRNGIKTTKREWEEHFQRAKQLERDRVRPSTALGLAPIGTRGALAPQTATAPATGKTNANSRQLHTSAGGRSGPGEHLLRASMPAVVYPVKQPKDGAPPDVLTL